jgi:dihydroneopterin aldolase
MPSPITYPAKLSLHQLRLMVHLGYGDAERATPQPILLDIDFYLSNLPRGCTQDGAGFLCYDKLATCLRSAIGSVHFSLIEYLAHHFGTAIDTWIAAENATAQIDHIAYNIRVHKCNAPVEDLLGGASFSYSTLPNGLA